MEDTYRIAASVLLIRPTDGDFEVLLLHKPRKNDAWQLPQGGCEEGETVIETALRELEEEAGISSGVEVLGESSQVYQYDFPVSYRRFRPDHICGQRIEYILAHATAPLEVQVDANEIDKHVWVPKNSIGKYIKRPEYLRLIHELFDEAVASIAK